MMQLKKLDHAFYHNNSHLKEALDNHNGNWEKRKVRGYGIVVIEINGLIFAIPLRSNIKHKAAYITVRSPEEGSMGKGLDFSKALLIDNPDYILNQPFKISPIEHKKLMDKEHHIIQKFNGYVEKYISAVIDDDKNILGSKEYKFSTLINYHLELGIKLT